MPRNANIIRRKRDFYRYFNKGKFVVSVNVSNKNIAAFLHDEKGRVVAGVSTIKEKELKSNQKSAELIGKMLSEKIKNFTDTVICNKSGLKYHGKVQKIFEGIRSGGIRC